MNRYKFISEGRKHLHTLDGKPLVGGSTAKGIVGKGEALMQWYADMAAVSALSLPVQDIKAEYEAAQKLTDKIARAKAKKALDEKYPNYALARKAAVLSRDQSAETGTLRHGALEEWIGACVKKGGTPDPSITYDATIEKFVEWSTLNVSKFYFAETYCYHESLWMGGIGDIGLQLKDGRRLVGDHKSSKEAYQDQFLQCAIYDVLLNHSGGLDADGNKLFDWELADGYVVFPFRSEPFTPEFRWNADEFRRGVESVAQLYKLIEL